MCSYNKEDWTELAKMAEVKVTVLKTSAARYCGIIIVRGGQFSWGTNVRGGPMVVVYVCNPCPRNDIPTNVYTTICLKKIDEIELSSRTRKMLTTHEH